jgi:uncharacterized protein
LLKSNAGDIIKLSSLFNKKIERISMRTSELQKIEFTGGFWGKIIAVNRVNTIPACDRQNQITGRIEAMKLQWNEGKPNKPHIFWDSDVAKWLEAAAYSMQTHPDKELEAQVDYIVGLIGDAQGDDGYFNSYFQQIETDKRWWNLRDMHELYCAGHLMEAAVAYYEASGKSEFLNIMRRYADYIGSVFGPSDEQMQGYPGHEEIELALVRLYEASGDERYLKLARFFIDERGTEPLYFAEEAERGNHVSHHELEHYQAHKPVREQDEAIGHAVRVMYLYAGMTDLARIDNDQELMSVCRKLWDNVVNKKMYITGAVGSCYTREAFTANYDLPNEEAYAETCASIGLIFFAYRMYKLERDAKYIDVLEKALYNGAMSGASLEGDRFFYVNPLACYPGGTLANGKHHMPRPDWFGCACCPPNVARLRASVGQYFYEYDQNNVWINLYNDSTLNVEIDNTGIALRQRTDYPWDGRIKILLEPESPVKFKLHLRIPEWCKSAELILNGDVVKHQEFMANGYIVLDREWQPGAHLELNLDMPVEMIYASPKVRHDCGKAALQRGPIIYCIEEVDNGSDLNSIEIAENMSFETCFEDDLLNGVVTVSASAKKIDPTQWSGALYSNTAPVYQPFKIKAVPYYAWGNRKFGEMLVWIRID